jgi:hypothetical protein
MQTNNSTVPRMAWLVVVLLMPVAWLNYLDRQMLAAMQSSVMGSIPSIGTDEHWGLHARTVQVGICVPQPHRRLRCGSIQPALYHLREPVRVVGGDVVDRTGRFL